MGIITPTEGTSLQAYQQECENLAKVTSFLGLPSPEVAEPVPDALRKIREGLTRLGMLVGSQEALTEVLRCSRMALQALEALQTGPTHELADAFQKLEQARLRTAEALLTERA